MTGVGVVLVFGEAPQGRRQLRQQLMASGYSVLIASSMAEAAKLLQSSTNVRVAVVQLADAAVAGRAIEHFRQLQPAIAIVVLGHDVAGDARTASIRHPENEQALHETVQRLSSAAGAESQASSA